METVDVRKDGEENVMTVREIGGVVLMVVMMAAWLIILYVIFHFVEKFW